MSTQRTFIRQLVATLCLVLLSRTGQAADNPGENVARYAVTVTPKAATFQSCATATFEVTTTNVGATPTTLGNTGYPRFVIKDSRGATIHATGPEPTFFSAVLLAPVLRPKESSTEDSNLGVAEGFSATDCRAGTYTALMRKYIGGTYYTAQTTFVIV